MGAEPTFSSYELRSAHEELLFSDFDGDGLDDIIMIDEPNLILFFQDRKNGFPKDPHLVYPLGDQPAVLWQAKLGKDSGQKVLVMTSDGVSTLAYTDKATPPQKQQIISRKTLIPEKCEESMVVFFTLSANTPKEFPAIFVPVENRLEIWQYDKQWYRADSLDNALEAQIWGPYKRTGYEQQYRLNMNIGDVNGDGLDDLVLCRNNKGEISFEIYPQTENGSFPPKPSQSFKDEWDWRSWVSLTDINKDGIVDFVKNIWLHEPWFLPGTYSGKVLVRIFFAQKNGSVPDKPTSVFRKNDWISSMPIVDLDGDGFPDIVLGYSLMREREDIRKSLTARRIDHYLRMHFFDNGRFPDKPDCQKDLVIHLGHRGIHLSWSQRYYLSTRISLDGDFNGDGRRDLLVKDAEDAVSVYFFRSRETGFSKKADMYFPNVEHVEQFIVDDLNKDGISDLMVRGWKIDSLKVFLSNRK